MNAMADPELTPSRPRADIESRLRFQKQTLKSLLKNDQMSLLVFEIYLGY